MKSLRYIIIFILLFSPIITTAAGQEYVPLAPISGFGVSAVTPTLASYLSTYFRIGIILAGALAVIMITVGGIQYMTTDAVFQKDEGKKRITAALGGLILALSTILILNTIDSDLSGSDGSRFSNISVEKIDVSSDSLENPDIPVLEEEAEREEGNTGAEGDPGSEGGEGSNGESNNDDDFVGPPGPGESLNTSLPITRAFSSGTVYGRDATANQVPYTCIMMHGSAAGQSAANVARISQTVQPGLSYVKGYHFVIDWNTGQIYQAAPVDKRTNHAPGYNRQCISISLANTDNDRGGGQRYNTNYDLSGIPMSNQQINSLRSLGAEIVRTFPTINNVNWHGNVDRVNRNFNEGRQGALLLRQSLGM